MATHDHDTMSQRKQKHYTEAGGLVLKLIVTKSKNDVVLLNFLLIYFAIINILGFHLKHFRKMNNTSRECTNTHASVRTCDCKKSLRFT